MERILLSLCLLLFTSLLKAQVPIDSLVNMINWNQTEEDFISTYSNIIQKRKHIYNEKKCTTSDYEVKNIQIGPYLKDATIYVDSTSRKVKEIYISFSGYLKDEFEGIDNEKDVLDLLGGYLIPFYGNPDVVRNGEDFLKNYNREWYKTGFKIESSADIFGDIVLCSIVIQELTNDYDFRAHKWGDPMSSIKEKEKGHSVILENDIIYSFKDNVAGMDCQVVCVFTDDKLSMAKYIFLHKHSDLNEYIADYNKLVHLMEDKYGKPDYNEPYWKNTLFKDDKDKYGLAIGAGHLSYESKWDNNKTEIMAVICGDNYKVKLFIQYVSKQYDLNREKQVKGILMDGL